MGETFKFGIFWFTQLVGATRLFAEKQAGNCWIICNQIISNLALPEFAEI